jgi:hypothetical protein
MERVLEGLLLLQDTLVQCGDISFALGSCLTCLSYARPEGVRPVWVQPNGPAVDVDYCGACFCTWGGTSFNSALPDIFNVRNAVDHNWLREPANALGAGNFRVPY